MALYGCPQRHAPQRIVLFRSVTQHVGRNSLVVGVERHKFRPDRDARRPGQGAHVDQKVRRFLVRHGQRVGENQPAFRIGIADLDREALARGVDIERTKRVAGDRILNRRDQHAAAAPSSLRLMIMLRKRKHSWPRRPCPSSSAACALDGLMSRPPVSKQTPLPTSVTFGCFGSPQRQIDQPRRVDRRAADRVDQRQLVAQQVVTDDRS